MMSIAKDFAWLFLIALLLPLWMLLALTGLVVIVGRHLYWWVRGNTTAASRPVPRLRWPWSSRRRSLPPDRREPPAERVPLVIADRPV